MKNTFHAIAGYLNIFNSTAAIMYKMNRFYGTINRIHACEDYDVYEIFHNEYTATGKRLRYTVFVTGITNASVMSNYIKGGNRNIQKRQAKAILWKHIKDVLRKEELLKEIATRYEHKLTESVDNTVAHALSDVGTSADPNFNIYEARENEYYDSNAYDADQSAWEDINREAMHEEDMRAIGEASRACAQLNR